MTNNSQAAPAPLPKLALDRDLAAYWNGAVRWFSENALEILIATAIATGIVMLLFALRRVGVKLCDGAPATSARAIVGRVVAKTGGFFIVMLAAQLVAGFARVPPPLAAVIGFLFTVAAVFQAANWIRELILAVIERRAGAEGHRGEAIANALGIIRLLVTVVLFAIALIVVLDNLGVNVTGLVAGLGVGGIAIGLAAQGIFSDLFAALSILFDRPFRRGDTIAWDKTSGAVEEIGLKSTRVRSITGEEVIISNANLLNKELRNLARLERRRIVSTLGLVYATPVEVCARIPEILKEIVESCENCVLVRAGLRSFAASSLDFELQYDVRSEVYDVVYAAQHSVNIEILRRFAAEGIGFAFPTQTSIAAAADGTPIAPPSAA